MTHFALTTRTLLRHRYARPVFALCAVLLACAACSSKPRASAQGVTCPVTMPSLPPAPASSAAAESPSATPSENTDADDEGSDNESKPFAPDGTAICAQTLNEAPGSTTGPEGVAATIMHNGRLRVYFVDRASQRVKSVVSDPYWQIFRADAGARLPAGATEPTLVWRDDAQAWRMYFIKDGVIDSATSTDALGFKVETGARLTPAQAGLPAGARFTGESVVHAKAGGYRLYVGVAAADGAGSIVSAHSTDGLNWTLDPGVRVGAGASDVTVSVAYPFARQNANGSTSLYYAVGGDNPAIYTAEADDGLDFEKQVSTTVPGKLDSLVVQTRVGDQMMFYDVVDPKGVAVIDVAGKPED